MAKKASTKGQRTINQRFTSLERLVRAGFRQTEVRFRRTETRFTRLEENSRRAQKRTERRFRLASLDLGNLRKEINGRFTVVEDRIDQLANHVDGFIKLHETLDIEMKVMKEQMNRFEARLSRLEATRPS